MQYETLADATVVTGSGQYGPGTVTIWYARGGEATRDWRMLGAEKCVERGLPLPNMARLWETHVRIGSVRETNLDNIFHMMQGENWSPRGEARTMVTQLGTDHTSMMMGDVIQFSNGECVMVDRFGFYMPEHRMTYVAATRSSSES